MDAFEAAQQDPASPKFDLPKFYRSVLRSHDLEDSLAFDAEGQSYPPGGPAWSEFLREAWGCQELLWRPDIVARPPIGGIVVAADFGTLLSATTLGFLVSVVDRGEAVALFARTPEALAAAVAEIAPLIGAAGAA